MKNNQFHLREATALDDKKIGDLLVDTFLQTYAKKMPEVVVTEERKVDLRNVAERRQNGRVLVLEDGNEIIATVSLIPYGKKGCETWSKDAACLRMMVVDPRYRGREISEMLIRACVKIAREWKLSAIELHVRRGAHGIARIYENLGFVRSPEGDQDRLPEIFMEAYRLKF